MSSLKLEAFRFRDYGPIDLTIAAGESVAVSGPSGAGKTLLLRAIADLDQSEGQVFADGVERASVSGPQWRQRVGLLFSESAWWGDRVGEHFAARNDDVLRGLGFPADVFDWPIARLSSGERQRLALARMLALAPRVLLLDEATANLDDDNTARVEALVERYRHEHRVALLWVTHDPRQAARIAARRLFMYDRRLNAAPPPAEAA